MIKLNDKYKILLLVDTIANLKFNSLKLFNC